jgi:gliding motility-associated protein GldM
MAGYKETPRQKMIGMMYLFYTALLALNVSVEILNAFVIVNKGMERTVENFGSKNAVLYSDFDAQLQMNAAKVKPYHDKAMEIKKATDALINQIESVKDKVIGYTEYGDKNAKNVEYKAKDKDGNSVVLKAERPSQVPLEYISNISNYDKPMEVLLGILTEKGDKGEANKLKLAFAAYKKNVITSLAGDTVGLKLGLETEDAYNNAAKQKQTWEMNTFYHTVLAADMVLLNKYITEVRNIEFEVIKRLYSQITAKDFKFDMIAAKLVPSANIVLSGETYVADIFVAAYSTTDTPSVIIKNGIDSLRGIGNEIEGDAGTVRINNAHNGVVKYEVKTGATGDFKFAGVIKIKDPSGSFKYHKFHSSYTVIRPTATVSADKMNVVYRGLKNPLSISAAGFTNEALNLTASGGGTLAKTSSGHYEFTPAKGGKEQSVTFKVSGKDGSGNTQSLGGFEYRIKNLPSPAIRIAGTSEGSIAKAKLMLDPKLKAQLDNFLFEGVQYNVLSYEIFVTHPTRGKIASANVKGSAFPGDVIGAIRQAPAKTLIIVRNVWVDGPDGRKQATGITLELL